MSQKRFIVDVGLGSKYTYGTHYHCVKSIRTRIFFFGPYFSVFNPDKRKYGPEKTPDLDT